MIATIDVNILLYTSDNKSPFYQSALKLMQKIALGPDLVYIFWPVITSYLRISTHPTIFEQPLSMQEAINNINELLNRPHIRAIGEGESFWGSYKQIASTTQVRGNLVPDAHLAALMREYGVSSIWSHDYNFRKFPGITMRDPFT